MLTRRDDLRAGGKAGLDGLPAFFSRERHLVSQIDRQRELGDQAMPCRVFACGKPQNVGGLPES
jgi:hypothetical protein